MKKLFLLDGKKIASQLANKIENKCIKLYNSYNIRPGLVVILVGKNPASETYVRNKKKLAQKVGFNSYVRNLEEEISEDSLLNIVEEYNNDSQIDGILVQLPLPRHINPIVIMDKVDPQKDVDGFNSYNTGLLYSGAPNVVPCTPKGCLILIKSFHDDISGKNALVVGRSNIVGKPMAELLLQENATVTLAHSKTKDLISICKNSDIIVSAIGKPKFIKADWVKEKSIIIDVGINYTINKAGKRILVGDVDFEHVKEICSAITPVPGGVGPMTIACLLSNTYEAAIKRREIITEKF